MANLPSKQQLSNEKTRTHRLGHGGSRVTGPRFSTATVGIRIRLYGKMLGKFSKIANDVARPLRDVSCFCSCKPLDKTHVTRDENSDVCEERVLCARTLLYWEDHVEHYHHVQQSKPDWLWKYTERLCAGSPWSE